MKGYVQILVFPCGRCNWPIAESQHSTESQTQADFDGRRFDLVCPHCEWEGAVFGAQAAKLQQVEWNFEIHSGLRTDKKQSQSEE